MKTNTLISPRLSNQDLVESIALLTAQIEENYPELYNYLDENAQLYAYTPGHYPSSIELVNHLSTLRQYLKHHIESHHVAEDNVLSISK